MKIACVLTTHLPIKAELTRHPELLDQPVIIVKELGPKRFVLDYSQQAHGISQGMPHQEAICTSKGAVLLGADEQYYQARFEEMLQALNQRSPLVEASHLGCTYVGLDGLEEMYGGKGRGPAWVPLRIY